MAENLLWEIVVVTITIIYQLFEGLIGALMPWSLKSKKSVAGDIVLVTGAGSGIGRLMAKRFASLGATLVLVDVNEAGNTETMEEIKQQSGKSYAYTCDLSDREAIYKCAEQIRRDVGDVTILVNNAGIVTGKTFMSSPDALIEKTMQVNCNAHFWTTKAFLPSMIAKKHGHIVSIASSAGHVGVNTLADYCASKFAAVGFNESLGVEMSALKTGVQTTTVCPYFIDTGMFDGVQSRFPAILPIIKPDYAVDCIMNAILTNQEVVMIPRGLYMLIAMKGIMPVKAGITLMNFFGATSAMNEFKGRQKVEKAE